MVLVVAQGNPPNSTLHTIIYLGNADLLHQLLCEGDTVEGAELQRLLRLLGPHQQLHGLVEQTLLHEVVSHPLRHLGAGAVMEVLSNLVQHVVVVVLEAEVQGVRDFSCLCTQNARK